MPTFEPPVAESWTFADGARTPGDRQFWSNYGLQPRGRSLLRFDGTWTEMDLPTSAQIDSTDRIVDIHGESVPGYLAGGHIHTITAEVADELQAQGYEVADFGGYGGGYAEGY